MSNLNLEASGDLTIGGDVVGRDKITHHIQTLIERALSAAEQDVSDHALETRALAHGLRSFAQRLQGVAASIEDRAPYQGPAAYRLDDAEFFRGRNAALTHCLRRLERGAVTHLHGEAGAGKTSFLQAGLTPALLAAGQLPVYVRAGAANPALLLKRAFLPDAAAAPRLSTAALADFLRQAGALLGARLVVLLDQADNLFTQLHAGDREEFIRALHDCLNDPTLNVRWVFALRSEGLPRLSGLPLHGHLDNELALGNLARPEALAVVAALSQKNQDDGVRAQVLSDLGGHDIPPTVLSVVCAALWEDARYHALGGAAGIWQRYAAETAAKGLRAAHRAAAQELLSANAAPLPAGRAAEAGLSEACAALLDLHLIRAVTRDGETVFAHSLRYRLPPTAYDAADREVALQLPGPAAPVVVDVPLPAEPPAGAPGPERLVERVPTPAAGPAPLTLAAQGDLIIAGDVVGRDKIIHNIQNIYQRALTAMEALASDREVEQRVVAQGVSAFARRLQAVANEKSENKDGSPYKGLLSYRLSDAAIFFGRSAALANTLGRLARSSFTVLHSESGAGKSSLLQAGLMPRLIGAGHLPVYLRPYNANPVQIIKRAFIADPSAAPLLATAPLREFLRQVTDIFASAVTLYLIIDQAEELFTQLEAPGRAEFIAELAECLDDASLNVRWLFSLRTEFFGNLANFRPQIQNPFENDVRLNRLTREEAREIVAAPAMARGLSFEDGLIDAMLRDLGQDNLPPPQLQLVCSGLFDELPPGARQFTIRQYDSLGRAAGILHTHLARVMGRYLSAPQRPVAQRVLEALISSQGRRVVRPRAELLAELKTGQQKDTTLEQLTAVLNQLVDSRLLRAHESEADAPTYELASGLSAQMVHDLAYELAHDYLLDQIRLDPEVQARKAAQELLEQEVRTYQQYQTLLSPERLAVIEPHLAGLRLTLEAQELVAASQAEIQREVREEEARRQKELEDAKKLAESERKRAAEQTRARQRTQWFTAGIAVVALVAVGLGVYAFIQQNVAVEQRNVANAASAQAIDQRNEAERQARLSKARELAAAAVSNLSVDPVRSILLALQAVTATVEDKTIVPEAEQALHQAVQASHARLTLTGHTGDVTGIAFSPDGTRLATASDDQTARVWDATTGHELLTLSGHTAPVYGIAFSPDGRRLATTSADQTARVWAAATGQELLTLSGHTGRVIGISFSPDGRLLATSSADQTARVW
ncbi:MAG: nSTAND1 domain-containing NTPase, partial [Anaerolineales bacterium]